MGDRLRCYTEASSCIAMALVFFHFIDTNDNEYA